MQDLQFDKTQIPNLDESKALVPTTNTQYNFESPCNLKTALLSSYSTTEVSSNPLTSIACHTRILQKFSHSDARI